MSQFSCHFLLGYDVWHSIADVIAVYLLFTILGPTSVALTLTWIITLVHQLASGMMLRSMFVFQYSLLFHFIS